MAIKTQAHWGSSYSQLTHHQIKTLSVLYGDALIQEKKWDKQLRDIFYPEGITNPVSTTEHGKYIKQYYNDYYKQEGASHSSIDSTFTREKIGDLGSQLVDDIKKQLNMNIFTASSVGLYGLEKALTRAIQNGDSKRIVIGRYTELNAFGSMLLALPDAIQDAASNLNTPVSIILKSTSTSPFKDSIMYDCLLSIDPKDKELAKKYAVRMPFEVKAGIKPDYLDSHFKFGTFSSSAFSYTRIGGQNDYEDLIDALQSSFRRFLTQPKELSIKTEPEITKWLNNQIINWGLEYIRWRLENNMLVFVSDDQTSVNLASEVLRGWISQSKGGYVDFFGSVLKFVDISSTRSYYYNVIGYGKKGRYTYKSLNATERVLERYDPQNGWEADKSFDSLAETAFKTARISPAFKATVWYGHII